MIRDAKSGLRTRLIEWYVARKVRSAFRGVWVRGTVPSADGGLLCYANHSSFWDGFIAHQLAHLSGWDGYAVMEEENLARYPFHAHLGAFSVRRTEPRSALATVRYAAKDVLKRPRAAVMIFPEGELHAGQQGPRSLKRGVEVIARLANCRSVAVAFRYAFLEHELPDVLIEVGTPHEPADLAHYERELKAAWERLASADSTAGFTQLMAGRRSVQERWDAVRGHRSKGSGEVGLLKA